MFVESPHFGRVSHYSLETDRLQQSPDFWAKTCERDSLQQ